VEAQRRIPRSGVLGRDPERVFELVAVAPLIDGRDDRLDLEPFESPEPVERFGDLCLFVGELQLVREPLPGGAGAGLAAVDAAVGDPFRPRLEQIDDRRLRPALLRLADPGADAVAGQSAADEDDEAPLGPGDPPPALGEVVDDQLELGPAWRPLAGLSLRGAQPSALSILATTLLRALLLFS
jgi:hypothetical protein